MNVTPYIIRRFYSLLTNRSQQVKINSVLSCVRVCSTGVPQRGVCSPFRFTSYTNDCRSRRPNNFILKFWDDTVILSLLWGDERPVGYLGGIDDFKRLIVSGVGTSALF